MQTNFSATEGNCFQACVASLFELNLDEVPHFLSGENGTGDEWWYIYNDWLSGKFNMFAHYIELVDDNRAGWIEWLKGNNSNFTAAVKCPSGLIHAVIIKGGEIVHNHVKPY